MTQYIPGSRTRRKMMSVTLSMEAISNIELPLAITKLAK